MSNLGWISAIAASLHATAGAAMLAAPARVRTALERLPRSRVAGTLLALAAVGWATWNLMHSNLGGFEPYKRYVPLAAGLLVIGIVAVMHELLAVRMAGALLMLAANPTILAARFHEDPWTRGLVAIAYVWIVVGMAWMLGPWRLRRWAVAALATPARSRAVAFTFLAVGAALFVLAYRTA
ncbi:MAG: hypothetical protein KBA51_06795 [Kiritimatiellae bacterium]|nr:hypothetical protein [Kiritimatiellia bacterium]